MASLGPSSKIVLDKDKSEILGYEETRPVAFVNGELKPGKTSYFFNVKSPDGSIEKIETDKDSVDRYIAERYGKRAQGPYSGT